MTEKFYRQIDEDRENDDEIKKQTSDHNHLLDWNDHKVTVR